MGRRLLVCDDEAGLREMLGVLFRRAGFAVTLANGVEAARDAIGAGAPFDVIVTDLVMPDGSGMEVLDAARALSDATQVVMITAHARTDQAVEAMRRGAYDYVEKPFSNDALRATVEKAAEKHDIVLENRALRAEVRSGYRRGEIVGRSEPMRRVIDLIDRVASSPASVLVTGESGTGKEVVARALHQRGDRRDGPFVAVNCGALPENLMESELFGHEKGAFTGAAGKKDGLFRAASGALFLDEVGELPTTLQVKLLRVLQERRVRPVGGEKEVVARALHQRGDRRDGPFVAVNCGALPENLMESELFGHEKGAFTGAAGKKDGLFRAASGGTLFLDEVGELPTTLQVKLLRVLQERRVRPVGGEKEVEVDTRVVAATNRDVEGAVAGGALRQDLYYRLNVIRIHLPPLRDRREDVPLLAEHFLARHAALHGKRLAFAPEAMRWLVEAPWPGNARELENVIERAVTLAGDERIGLRDLFLDPPPFATPEGAPPAPPERRASLEAPARLPDDGLDLDRHLAEVERRLLTQALAQAGGVRTHAARLVGMSFRSFRYRLAKYGIGGGDDTDDDG